jgi:hypothetical protein
MVGGWPVTVYSQVSSPSAPEANTGPVRTSRHGVGTSCGPVVSGLSAISTCPLVAPRSAIAATTTAASPVEPVPLGRPARGLDRGRAVVGREPLRCREPGRVTDVTEDEPSDDGPDAVELEQGRPRLDDGIGDPAPGGGDLAIEATHIGELLVGEALALDLDDAVRADRAQQLGSSISRQPPGCAASDELRRVTWSRHAAWVRSPVRSS